MAKQLPCPMAFNRSPNMPCKEEECSWWIAKGVIEKDVTGVNKSMTTYTPTGACAIKVLAMRIS